MSALIGVGRPSMRTVTGSPCARSAEEGRTPSPQAADVSAVPLGVVLQTAARAVKAGLPNEMWVHAAVASTKPAAGGHTIELVEPDVPRAEAGVLRSYLPDRVVEKLRANAGPAIAVSDLAGMAIVVQLRVELHKRWGLSGRIVALGPGIEQSLARRALETAIARLRRSGDYDRQRRLAQPRDITRVAVVHPPAAAGWSDIAGELSCWSALGLIVMRSVPAPFEGPGAAHGIAAALGRATALIDGSVPDVAVICRGGGAAASLAALDDETLALAMARCTVPIITGLGHAIDLTLADRVCWRSVDTPSKAAALVREIMIAPARKALADRAAIVTAVVAGVDRERPCLAAVERAATAAALGRAVAASERLERAWGTIREAAERARGSMERLDAGLDHLMADLGRASPAVVGRTASELAARMEAIRARARRTAEAADDGGRHRTVIETRARALLAHADVTLGDLSRGIVASVETRTGRATAQLDLLIGAIHERARANAERATDGAHLLASVVAAVRGSHRDRQDAVIRLRDAIELAVGRHLDAAAASLDRSLAVLDGADPVHILRRGYALVTDGDGRAVTSLAAARSAARLNIIFADGSLAVASAQPSINDGDTT